VEYWDKFAVAPMRDVGYDPAPSVFWVERPSGRLPYGLQQKFHGGGVCVGVVRMPPQDKPALSRSHLPFVQHLSF
jgi:hypothetical protein